MILDIIAVGPVLVYAHVAVRNINVRRIRVSNSL